MQIQIEVSVKLIAAASTRRRSAPRQSSVAGDGPDNPDSAVALGEQRRQHHGACSDHAVKIGLEQCHGVGFGKLHARISAWVPATISTRSIPSQRLRTRCQAAETWCCRCSRALRPPLAGSSATSFRSSPCAPTMRRARRRPATFSRLRHQCRSRRRSPRPGIRAMAGVQD